MSMRESKAGCEVTGLEIAVIGMAGRFPGAANTTQFWENLKNGRESIYFLSTGELEQAGVNRELLDDPQYVKAIGAIIEDKDAFDAFFFGYTPVETEVMDPQMRIFHECAWEALEDAAYNPETYKGIIGLYTGTTPHLNWVALSYLTGLNRKIGSFAATTLNESDFISTRLAYNFNLRGPAISLQTACSTSLVALHLACQGLLSGECDIALVGGVRVSSSGKSGYLYQQGGITSSDGHCRAFTAEADGCISGEGVGVVVLKPLTEAEAEGDYIHAIIKGSAINNDGHTKVGYTAPSINGQAAVIRSAVRAAQIEPNSIGYIETHGTGTNLGDPIEIEALKKAFHIFGITSKESCAIGSVKTNIGHLGSAAGIAGLIKTILALKHRQIPPSLNFQTPNPKLDIKNSPFFVNTKFREWKSNGYPLRAGVSSFGIGGTNAHVVLEQAPEKVGELTPFSLCHVSGKSRLIILSAKTSSALEKMTQNLAIFLRQNPNIDLADAAYTLQVGRKHLEYRRTTVYEDVHDLIEELCNPGSHKVHTWKVKTEKRPVIFMFPGLGGQYVDMGRELYQKEPFFREEMDRCFRVLDGLMDVNVKEILYPSPVGYKSHGSSKSDISGINRIEIAQVVIFIFEYTLAKLLTAWEIKPLGMIGYSFGEYTAACIAGVFSLEDALELVVTRGRMMEKVHGGAMLSVPVPVEEIKSFLNPELSVAINNGPSCIIAGGVRAVEDFERQIKEKKIICMRVPATHALHSQMMDPLLPEYENQVRRVRRQEPQIPYISNVTGKWITAAQAVDPAYWAAHLRETVQFAEGIRELVKEDAVWVEVGVGRDLSTLVSRYTYSESDRPLDTANLVQQPGAKMADVHFLLRQLGRLWQLGVGIDWELFYRGERRHRLPLPTYPFEKKRYWMEGDVFRPGGVWLKTGIGREQSADFADWFYLPTWKRSPRKYPANPGVTAKGEQWLVLADEDGLGTRVGEYLRQDNRDVVVVHPGTAFTRAAEREYTITPGRASHYNALLDTLEHDGHFPTRILHFWTIHGQTMPREDILPGSEEVIAAQDKGVYSLLHLVQALGNRGKHHSYRIAVVTHHLQAVSGDEVLSLENAPLIGLLKVIPQEYPQIRCQYVDVSLPRPGTIQEIHLVKRLIEEFAGDLTDTAAAYRGLHRWVEEFEPLHLEKKPGTPQILKRQGIYLITGGLGRIGLMLARYLARTVNARLILTSRSLFPSKQERAYWLQSHKETDPLYRKVNDVVELENMGAEVWVLCADVSDESQMQEVISRVETRWGTINGLIHAAGIIRGDSLRPVRELGKEYYHQQFLAKIQGTLVLERLFRHKALDFCLLFSSISVVLGGLGFSAYAAANSFMAAFVYQVNLLRSDPWISLDWDGMEEEKTIDAFQRVIELRHINRVVVSNGGNLEKRIRQWIKLEPLHQEKHTDKDASSLSNPRPQLPNPYIAPRNELERILVRIWQQLFGFDKIGLQDDFLELGGDSLKAITVLAAIHKELKIEVPLTEFFKQPTIEQLARYIRGAEKKPFNSTFTPLQPVEEKEYHLLSSAQKRMYLLQQLNVESTAYNTTLVYIVEGPIDKVKLQNTFTKLINRHESLRTSIFMLEDVPVQKIHKEVVFELEFYHGFLSQKALTGSAAAAAQQVDRTEEIVKEFIKPFDLGKAPPLRVGLIRLEQNKHILAIDMHHVVTDGISFTIFFHQITALYSGQPLASLKLQYKDYAQWQNQQRLKKSAAFKQREQYWLKTFEDEIPVLNLPIDYPRPTINHFKGNSVVFDLPKEETMALKKLVLEEEVTLFILMLSLVYVLLAKICGQEDIVIGTPLAGRNDRDLENIIGMFLNTLALRNYHKGENAFSAFLKEVKERTLTAFENQDYPFEDLVERLEVPRDTGREPLFSVLLILENYHVYERKEKQKHKYNNTHPRQSANEYEITGGLKFKPFAREVQATANDLTLYIDAPGENLHFSLQYSTQLFKENTIRRFVGYFKTIVNVVINNRQQKLAEIEIISEHEKQQILFDFNDTKKDIQQDKCCHQLFEEQVLKHPHRTAAVFNDLYVSYEELNREANCIANYFSDRGAVPGTIAALYLRRSIRMLTAIIGVFKAGCVYLPIEVDYPQERIQYMVKDSNAQVLLVDDTSCASWLSFAPKAILNMSAGQHLNFPASQLPSFPASLSSNLAYIIYTSGTTGKPKGVMIHHLGMINHLFAKINDLTLTGDDIIAQTASSCFDISVWQFLAGLLKAGTIVIIDKETVLEGERLLAVLQEKKVTVLELVPSLMTAFLDMVEQEKNKELKYLRWMIPTGEALSVMLVQRWYRFYPGIKLVNAYGPTEASDDVSHYVIPQIPRETRATIPIGKPLQNLHIYILDKYLKLCPVGVRGEICVAGIGVGKGYWQDPEKTREVFVSNPYLRENGDESYAVLYKTGDTGYWREDGNLECLGRLDDQVKIRGNRIQLGEIETQLLSHHEIKETVVIERDDKNDGKYLCAYIVPAAVSDLSPHALSNLELKDYLSDKLPDYMIPSYFILLDKLPLTANGKVNRKILPVPETTKKGESYTAPRNHLEKKVRKIWLEVLFPHYQDPMTTSPEPPQAAIGIDDNFFRLGGHSLKAAALVAKIHRALNVKLPMIEVFKTPTIRGLAAYIKNAAQNTFTFMEPVEEKEYYPLSSAQKRVYTMQQIDKCGVTYNLPLAVRIEGVFDNKKIEETFAVLIKRHESLRTSFMFYHDLPVQKINKKVEFTVHCGEVPGFQQMDGSSQGRKVQLMIEDFVKPFDLTRPPLLRVGVTRLAQNNHILMMDIHHIITDAMSNDILVREFALLYGEGTLMPLQLRYRDYSQWQSCGIGAEIQKKQETFWLETFEDHVPVLDMPTNYKRPPVKNFEGENMYFTLNGELTRKLEDLVKNTGTTLFMVLLTGYYVLLAKYTRQEDIVVGSPVMGRPHADLEPIIGMFVNMIALRSKPQENKVFRDYLLEVKQDVLAALENQDYQFEELVDKLELPLDPGRNPLFDTVFTFNDIGTAPAEMVGLKMMPHTYENKTAKFDILLEGSKANRILNMHLEYSTSLFKKSTAEEIIKHYIEILEQAVENGDISIKEFRISSQLVPIKSNAFQEEQSDFAF